MSNWARRIEYARSIILAIAAGALLSVILLLLTLRYFLPSLPNYRVQVQEILSGYLGAVVRIGTIEPRWNGWQLILTATDLNVTMPDGTGHASIAQLDMEVSIIPMLLARDQLQAGRVHARGLSLDYQGGNISAPTADTPPATLPAIPLDLTLHDSRVSFGDNQQLLIPTLHLLKNNGRHHLMAVLHPPGQHHQAIRAELQWQGDATEARLRYTGTGLNMADWLQQLGLEIPTPWPQPGTTPVDLQGELLWRSGQWHSARVHINGTLQLQNSAAQTVTLPDSSLLLAAMRNDRGQRFLGGYLRSAMATAQHTPLQGNEFRVALDDTPALQIKNFDLQLLGRLWPLTTLPELPLPTSSGILQQAELLLGGNYPGRLQFAQLRTQAAMGSLKHLEDLAGQVHFDNTGGRAELQAQAMEIQAKSGYALQLAALTSQLSWQRNKAQRVLQIHTLQAALPGITEATLSGNVSWHADDPAYLKLRAHIPTLSHTALLELLPDSSRAQAEQRVLAGDFADLQLHWDGTVAEGTLQTEVTFNAASLATLEDWPQLHNAVGKFQSHGRRLELQLHTADWYGLSLEATQLTMQDLGSYEFDLQLHGDIAPLLQLSNRVQRWIQPAWQMGGDVTLALQGTVTADTTELASMQGQLQLHKTALLHPEHNLQFRDLEGTIQLQQGRLYSTDLHGYYRDSPVHFEFDYADALHLTLQLDTDADALARELELRMPEYTMLAQTLSGRTEWTGSIQTEGHGEWELELHSQLQGLAIDLPDPFGKYTATATPLQFKALLSPHRTHSELHYRGQILRSTAAGLHWQGHIPRLSVAEWEMLQPSHSNRSGGIPRGLHLDLEIDTLHWRNHDYSLSVHAEDSPLMWQVELDGEDIRGLVRVIHSNDPLWDIYLEHLVYSNDNSDSSDSGDSSTPQTYPRMRVSIEALRFAWDPEHAWQLQLDSQRTADGGLRYEPLSLQGEGLSLSGMAQWQPDRSTVDLQLDVAALQHFLRLVGEDASGIEEAPGSLRLQADWPGSLSAFSLADMTGTLQLDFAAGQLLQVDTGGVWLLGLLSMQNVFNIITLDFLKLFEQGLSFERLHGEFEIRDGNAYTTGLKLEGRTVELVTTGRSGLVDRDYDQQVTATPDLYASLPLTGLIFGPIGLGASYAAYILSSKFKGLHKGVNQLARKRYHITGSWDNPVVEKLQESLPQQGQIELQKP